MSNVFKLRNTPCYNLRDTSQFSTDPIHSVHNGTESASYLGPKFREQIPEEIKNKQSLDGFKREIKISIWHLLISIYFLYLLFLTLKHKYCNVFICRQHEID